jgi:hypothetical protein
MHPTNQMTAICMAGASLADVTAAGVESTTL